MYKTLKCVVIDDDQVSLKVVEALIKQTDFLSLQKSFSDAVSALSYLSKEPTDLLFCDIEMPKMSGLELVKSLVNSPQVILIGSKEKYALESYDYEVVDYLLKPIDSYARFLQAANKAKAKYEESNDNQKNIFIKVDSLLINFDYSDILWVEAYGDYVKIKTEEKVHTVYSTLKAIEDKLPRNEFVRVHRSYIVRIDKIKNIDLHNLQISNKIIPISNSYKANLMESINRL
jgi:DNA-binding LytR/AlgR family response regulator